MTLHYTKAAVDALLARLGSGDGSAPGLWTPPITLAESAYA